ncbi:hypothetical protein EV383_4069 [Pseudonocardia sediminis]|uniref:Integral membrane protein n=1 Tax=Pseudonocardia sediminis TaxID=1397368 RepID=A0A4Q7V1G6_PSEST|nr:hypothetical protein [Pseudonocardia sediminis]RZT87161.1 hypothetical protein EV383_4069 [Pseudonocardia sediminis]
MRVYYAVAAVLGLLHGLACALGAMGMGATADQADPMTTDEALGVAGVVFAVGVATIVGAALLLVGKKPTTMAIGLSASLVVSGYVALRWMGEIGGYQLPAIYAVLPVVALAAVAVGARTSVTAAPPVTSST